MHQMVHDPFFLLIFGLALSAIAAKVLVFFRASAKSRNLAPMLDRLAAKLGGRVRTLNVGLVEGLTARVQMEIDRSEGQAASDFSSLDGSSRARDAVVEVDCLQGHLAVYFMGYPDSYAPGRSRVSSVGARTPATVVEFRRASTKLPRLQIYSEMWFHKIGALFGWKDIRIGDAAFDDAFVLRSDDEGFIRRLLEGDELRFGISNDLAHGRGQLLIDVLPGRITVRRTTWLTDWNALLRYVERSRSLIEGVLRQAGGG